MGWDDTDFLSGGSGQVWGVHAVARAALLDARADVAGLARADALRLDRAASDGPRRRVLVISADRSGETNLLARAKAELARSRHDVILASRDVGELGKFENLNRLLVEHDLEAFDWLVALDDDVALARHFLDRFIFLAERFDLRLAQPAHRHRSHAAWPVTRRRRGSLVRQTAFVEIGPVTAFHASTFSTLLPFPPLRFGWGLDLHWAAVARERGWRIGVVDATPVSHGLRRIASSYRREDAIAEARTFLAEHPYVPASEAGRTLAVHRSWR